MLNGRGQHAGGSIPSYCTDVNTVLSPNGGQEFRYKSYGMAREEAGWAMRELDLTQGRTSPQAEFCLHNPRRIARVVSE